MRRSIRVLQAAALTLAAVTVSPARADPPFNDCTTASGLSCEFTCNVWNKVNVSVVGEGTGAAHCSNVYVSCTSPNGLQLNCGRWSDDSVTDDDDHGTCGFVGVGVGTVRCYAT